MRIVQLASIPGVPASGPRTFVDEVGRGYGEAGHDRVLVVPGARDSDEHTVAGRLISLASPTLPTERGYRVLLARQRLRALLDELRPDALEVDDRMLLGRVVPWARSAGVPVLLFAHRRIDAALRVRMPAGRPLTAAAELVDRRLVRSADRVVVASEFAAQELRRVGAAGVTTVPPGVDLEVFRPAAAARPGAGRSVQLVLVGRLSREKQPELAVEALRVLLGWGVPAGLLVVGDGPLRRRMAAAAAGLPVRLLGHVADRRCLPHLVGSADVTIAPAPRETLGLAVLESLACGTPVVVPAAGATRELLGGPGSGVVAAGTAVGIANGVLSVLDTPAPERRAAARARAEHFPWSATVAGMLAAHGARTPAVPVR